MNQFLLYLALALGSLRCCDNCGQKKIIQINGSKENLLFIIIRVSNAMNDDMNNWGRSRRTVYNVKSQISRIVHNAA